LKGGVEVVRALQNASDLSTLRISDNAFGEEGVFHHAVISCVSSKVD
jgi:hypothetical protein